MPVSLTPRPQPGDLITADWMAPLADAIGELYTQVEAALAAASPCSSRAAAGGFRSSSRSTRTSSRASSTTSAAATSRSSPSPTSPSASSKVKELWLDAAPGRAARRRPQVEPGAHRAGVGAAGHGGRHQAVGRADVLATKYPSSSRAVMSEFGDSMYELDNYANLTEGKIGFTVSRCRRAHVIDRVALRGIGDSRRRPRLDAAGARAGGPRRHRAAGRDARPALGGAAAAAAPTRRCARAAHDAARTAARPAAGPVGASAEAVLFADDAELLACMLRDLLDGTFARAWWWAAPARRAAGPAAVVARAWVERVRGGPGRAARARAHRPGRRRAARAARARRARARRAPP